MTPKTNKKLLIVGAGASGLPSLRHALLYGVDVTCFELTNQVGGLWNYKPQETTLSSVMKTTVINTSKEMTAYSDFPPEGTMANFMHNTEMYRYLHNYAKHYDLEKHIKFNHKVNSIHRNEDYDKTGKWKVNYTDDEGATHDAVFDGILLCSGHHTTPNWPKKFRGQNDFKGRIIHSHSYKGQKIKKEDWREMEMSIYESGGDETSFREVAEEKDISQEMAQAAFEEILHNKRQGESQYRFQRDRSLEACPSDALPIVFIPCKYQNMEDPRCCLNNMDAQPNFQVFPKPRCNRNLHDISLSPIGRSVSSNLARDHFRIQNFQGSLPVDRPLFVRTSTPMRPTRSVTGSVDSLPSSSSSDSDHFLQPRHFDRRRREPSELSSASSAQSIPKRPRTHLSVTQALSPAAALGAPLMSPAMPTATFVNCGDSQASQSGAQLKICARTGASYMSKCGQGCSDSANQW
ncbi:Protein CBG22582 [Caenorhabditis briggsae]|uniref:Flavin-containing monooxygenase n=1 Tax=Caenorhabditis briggsae TaxID=6238 RepID=A8Y2M0_CAEBR|nr:Protein CBG22582 [Caenorhabditis briggsae]CAP39144.2 Protein CBG22582 [Caenorhabditis briggsae]